MAGDPCTCPKCNYQAPEPMYKCKSCGDAFQQFHSCKGMTFAEPRRMMEVEQPKPTPNGHPVIQEIVMRDMQSRLNIGLQRYGTGLQPHNGRDMLRDAYEEALDLCVYLRGAMYERDGK